MHKLEMSISNKYKSLNIWENILYGIEIETRKSQEEWEERNISLKSKHGDKIRGNFLRNKRM